MYNILTLNKIAAVGTNLLDTSKYNFGTDVTAPDAVLVRSGDMHSFPLDGILGIARAGAGVNNIPVEACTEKGIVVFNTPGANANAVKELVLGALFIASRNVAQAIDWAKTLKGKGADVPKLVENGKGQFVGNEVFGKKLGVIGLGAIGVAVANACVGHTHGGGLGMTVAGYDPKLTVENAHTLSVHIKNVALDKIYTESDFISLHVPSLKETKGFINTDAIAKMKDGVIILNFARGDLIDEQAVLAALESGKIKSYITDFPSDALIGAKGVTAIPHLGASTPESEDNCAVMAVQELRDYLETGRVKNSVNLPNLTIPPSESATARICVIHKDEQGVLANITEKIHKSECNIENMGNRTRKDNGIAYAVLDVSGGCDTAFEAIKALPHIISARIIKA